MPKPKTKSRRKGNPDALARHREAKQQAAAEQQEAALATAVKTGDVELSGDLAAVFVALTQAQKGKDTAAALEQIQDAFGNLDQKALSQIVNTPIVQDIIGKLGAANRGGRRPGDYIFDKEGRPFHKIPWTAQDVKDNYPMVKWTPAETMPITFNGHTIQVNAFEEIETPSIFCDIYKQHLEATRHQAEDNAEGLRQHFGNEITVGVGWPGKQPLPSK